MVDCDKQKKPAKKIFGDRQLFFMASPLASDKSEQFIACLVVQLTRFLFKNQLNSYSADERNATQQCLTGVTGACFIIYLYILDYSMIFTSRFAQSKKAAISNFSKLQPYLKQCLKN